MFVDINCCYTYVMKERIEYFVEHLEMRVFEVDVESSYLLKHFLIIVLDTLVCLSIIRSTANTQNGISISTLLEYWNFDIRILRFSYRDKNYKCKTTV